MSGLPPGWEWDYDGARWFYRYKPNGHVQFHFPKEGDEFPDFVDILSPAPELAPEEKLESQQQLRRRFGNDADPPTNMRATGGPLADFGMNRSGFGGPGGSNDDDDGDGFFYQPENFMYLGPGAYTDVSPSVDEDERDGIPNDRHKSKVKGVKEEAKDKTMLDATGDETVGVSPLQSQTNTPSVVNSVLVREEAAVPEPVAEEPPTKAVLIVNTEDLAEPSQPAITSPGVPLLDSIEKPRQEPPPSSQSSHPAAQPQAWDPVGIMAEMATEHTAPAHIEIYPDPVEMGDNAVLAPIETRILDLGIAELPERNSPSDQRPSEPSTHDLLHQTSMTDAALHGATFGSGSRPQSSSPTGSTQANAASEKLTIDRSLPEAIIPQPQTGEVHGNGPFNIKRKPSNTGATQSKYQPYIPGVVPTVATEKQNRDPDFKRREHSNSLTREVSLMMGTRQKFEPSSIPSVLQPPQIPPKHPLDSTQQQPLNLARPEPPPVPRKELTNVTIDGGFAPGTAQAHLQLVPSVLKPARGRAPENGVNQSQEVVAPPYARPTNPSTFVGPNQSVPNPTRYSAFQPGLSTNQDAPPSVEAQLYSMPQPGLRPHSLTPAPGQQPSMGIRPGAHRFETAPAQPSSDARTRLQAFRSQAPPTTPSLPQFLQRPQAELDIEQSKVDFEQPGPLPTATRARSRSDLPQPLSAVQGLTAFPSGKSSAAPSSETTQMPSPKSSITSNTVIRPQSAMDFMQGYSATRPDKCMQQSEPSPPSDRGIPRQTSFASSEVSSLGPPSGSQSSGLPMQTPSPMENGGRRPSSGFFRGAGPNAPPTAPSENSFGANQRSFDGHSGPIRPTGTRPASFSGPSPTSTLPPQTGYPVFHVAPGPPAIPEEVPVQPRIGAQPSSSAMPGNRTIQNLIETPHSPSSNRRHSSPPEPLATITAHPPGSSNHPQRSPQHPHDGIGMPSVVPVHSTPGKPLDSLPAAISPHLPYRLDTTQKVVKQSSDRPQRPTVTPPSQQLFNPLSVSTPLRSPGHILQPIQEHHEGDHIEDKPAKAAPPGSQDTRRHFPSSTLQMSSGSSHYPSAAESFSGQNVEQLTTSSAHSYAVQPNPLQQQPQLMPPAVSTSGQTYSPIQHNPFQQSPTVTTPQSLQDTGRPNSTSPLRLQPAKEKEKGMWLAKLIKSSGKPAILQKPQLPNQAFSTMPQSPHAASSAQGQWPQSAVTASKPGWSAQQPFSQPISNSVNTPVIPPMVQNSHSPESGTSIPAEPQNMPVTSKQSSLQHSFGRPEVQNAPQQPTTASMAHESPDFQINQSLNGAQELEQRPSYVPPRGLTPTPGPPSDQIADNMSDVASVSAFSVSTMDVSEAQAQPVLKPQLVTVEKNAPPLGQHQLPSRIAMSEGFIQQPPPISIRQGPKSGLPMDSELTVAPLFSKPQTKTTVTTMTVNQAPAASDKWAKKPAVDYSGDDWGDDPWDYQ